MNIEYNDSNEKLMRCRACNDLISKNAKSCPCCGEPYGSENGKKGISLFYLFATIICVIGCLITDNDYFILAIVGLWFSYAWIMCVINAIRGE